MLCMCMTYYSLYYYVFRKIEFCNILVLSLHSFDILCYAKMLSMLDKIVFVINQIVINEKNAITINAKNYL